jgi:hypothetical protein
MAIFFPSSLQQAACQHVFRTVKVVQLVDNVAIFKWFVFLLLKNITSHILLSFLSRLVLKRL